MSAKNKNEVKNIKKSLEAHPNKFQRDSLRNLRFKNFLIIIAIFVGIFLIIFLAVRQNKMIELKKEAEKFTIDDLMAKAELNINEQKLLKDQNCKRVKIWTVSFEIFIVKKVCNFKYF
jgi:hypothetical protein